MSSAGLVLIVEGGKKWVHIFLLNVRQNRFSFYTRFVFSPGSIFISISAFIFLLSWLSKEGCNRRKSMVTVVNYFSCAAFWKTMLKMNWRRTSKFLLFMFLCIKKHNQQVKRSYSHLILHSCETPPRLLCPAQWPPTLEECKSVVLSP